MLRLGELYFKELADVILGAHVILGAQSQIVRPGHSRKELISKLESKGSL